MTNASTEFTSKSGITVGIDIGDKFSQFCLVDADGVVEEARVRTSVEAFRTRLGALDPSLVVIEVGTHSRWVRSLAQALGHTCLVANSQEASSLYSRRKNDRNDALTLARQGRTDPGRLYPVHHRAEDSFADLAIIHSRAILVETRTALINRVRGVVKSKGARLPRCATRNFPDKAGPALPDALRPALEPLLELVRKHTAQIQAFDKQIEALIEERYPEASQLRQPGGVGSLTALTFVLTIGDPWRFRRSRSLGPYLGLTRKQKQSGDRDPELGISKAGDPYLRTLLIEAAHYIIGPFGPDCDLRRWALMRSGGKNANKRTVVAVARKLAVLLHRLWVSNAKYEPLRTQPAQRSGEVVPLA